MEPQEYTLTGNPYLKKVLDISTSHITLEDNKLLSLQTEELPSQGPCVYNYLEGYFVFVSSNPDNFKSDLVEWEKHFSPEFCRIMLHAHTIGVNYVQFDADGVEYKDLKTFSWDTEEEVA